MSGDTLWDIAARYLGDPERWTEVYDTNQAAIEASAREHPESPVLGASDHGHWIFPGTRLTIPGANCAPTTPTTQTTPTTGGGVSDRQACEAVGRPWVSAEDGGPFCGTFGTISVPEHPFSPGELDQLKFAADTVGCLKDVAGIVAGVPGVLSTKGQRVVDTILFVDGVVTELKDVKPGDVVQMVTEVTDLSSGHVATVIWNLVPGTACVELFYNRAVAFGVMG
ncbi:LysM peptidoglycan-binding domain-containing protein [Streptomyces cahuitamycinicus]|uniref:LysM domain-containing protein n=1 Tax=Streptomyces cahuitamycinicus TaxID=2070367 RepID=A0A2N8TSA6_9ACTN|nr:LysM peptidoglycan-binding domain-containing protein [Streptomyces cahuitamycinicus]PNG21888.1 hypothetical protein C1J00_12325 [Streptomyces cahuitamycinicus]